jgi:Restriction endonuclease
MPDDEDVPTFMERYPPADITPQEFEQFVGETLREMPPDVTDVKVNVLERVSGHDGSYVIDATVRCRLGGMDLFVVVEAKKHTNPIKRDVVQTLNAKKESLAAHKAVLFSTTPFQSGAIEYARAHGIALVHVTEGRFTFETRSAGHTPVLSREDARQFGLPTFVGHHYAQNEDGNLTMTLVTGYPEYAMALLQRDPS